MAEEHKVLKPDEVVAALKAKSYNYLRQRFKSLEPADIAESLRDCEPEECAVVFRLIMRGSKADVFAYLPFDTQEALLRLFPEDAAAVLLNEMEPVDRTQLLEDLPPEISSRFILNLSPKERQIAWRLLSYPEDSVGRLMTPEFVSIRSGMRVSEAIEYIRWNAARYPEELLQQIYVVDEQGKYLGDVSIGGLFIADPSSQPVENIVGTAYVALSAYDEEGAAVDAFRKYDKAQLPVLDDHSVLVGVVTADDVFDVAEEEATEDIHQFGGTASLEESYFATPVLKLLRKRAGWLALLFIGEIWTGYALRHYEHAIQTYAFLVFFLPLIISSGGNSGSQAASLIIRGIAIREMEGSDWLRVLWREIATGLGLGLILGVMGYFCAIYWNLDSLVGFIVGFSLIGIVVFGAVTGAMLPFILKRINLDPAVSSSPLIASLVDLFGILIFFSIAISMMQTFG